MSGLTSGAGAAAAGWRARLAPLGIAAITFACFQPALAGEFLHWDDEQNFVQNPAYRGLGPRQIGWMFGTFHMGHYQPLSWLSLGLDYTIWGMNPGGYHLTNVLLHSLNAVLVYFLLLALVRASNGRGDSWTQVAAALGSLAFAVHPLRVESVAWITERRDVLSTAFLLSSALCYLRYAGDRGGTSGRWYGLSLACFALSLLSKAWGMTFPAVLLILDAFSLRRWERAAWRRIALEKAPFAGLALVAAAVALLAQKSAGALMAVEEHGVIHRGAQAFYGIAFYLLKTTLPTGLSPLYLKPAPFDPWQFRYVISVVLVVAATAVFAGIRKRRPEWPAAWAAFLVLVSPVLGFAQSGPQLVADRYTYLAGIPWVALLAGALCRVEARRARWAAVTAGAAVLAVLGVATFRYSAVWGSTLRLFDHAIAQDANNYYAYCLRGLAHFHRGEADRALADFDACVRLNARFAHGFSNRGMANLALHRLPEAMRDFDRAVELAPAWPEPRVNRAVARRAAGDLPGALRDLTEAIEANERFWGAYLKRGFVLLELGRAAEARRDFEAVIAEDAEEWPAYVGRAESLRAEGDLRAAILEYERLLDRAPREWSGRREAEARLADARDALRGGR